MDLTTIHSKTAKGVTQITKRAAPLSKDLMNVLKMVDGKSTLEQTSKAADLPVPTVEKALTQLAKEGFIRVFETKVEDSGFSDEGDDFDFTKAAAPSARPASAGPAPKVDAAAEAAAREKAQAEARARAEREAQIRARLEVEARAQAEAERRAIEEAKRMQEASERAKRELESKLAEEAARKKAAAESHVKLTQEQQLREAEAAKALALARAKAESEAKSLAEARAKAEAEARALAEARVKAEMAAKKQAEEAASAQRDLRAQLKEEIEARIRAEMESKLREEFEEGTRAEMEQAVMADAREEARAELERRLAEESDMLERAGAEAKRKAEEEAKRMLAEQETRLRAEMEQRIKAETEKFQREALAAKAKAEREAIERQELEDRLKKEAEARRRMEQEAAAQKEVEAQKMAALQARARQEAEQRAKVEQEMSAQIEAEKMAKYEAEARAKIEAEQRAKVQAETNLKLEAERRARAEAEEKAARQAEESDRISAEVEGRIEVERKAREKAEAKSRSREEEEEADRKAQVERLKLLQAQADERARKETEALESGGASRHQKVRRKGPTPWGTYIVTALVLIVGGGIGLLHVIPMTGLQAKVQKGLSEWMHDEVSISGVNFALFPSPRLTLKGLTVGAGRDAAAGKGLILIPVSALYDDNVKIDNLELQQVNISNAAASRIPLWAKAEGRPDTVSISRIVLRNVTLDSSEFKISEFHATISFDKGNLKSALLQSTDNKWSLDARPDGAGWAVEVGLKGMPLPVGIPIPLDDVRAKGTVTGQQLIFPEVSGTAYFGTFTGSAKADWSKGLNVNAEISVNNMNSTNLFETFTKDVQITGRLEGAFSINAAAPNIGDLMKAPSIVGNYTLKEGSVSNVDLVQAMRTEGGGRGGATKFSELAGGLNVSNGEVRYNKLRLQGGVILATGDLVIGANDQLGGRLNVELKSSVAQDRGSFGISGTVQKPTLRRGS